MIGGFRVNSVLGWESAVWHKNPTTSISNTHSRNFDMPQNYGWDLEASSNGPNLLPCAAWLNLRKWHHHHMKAVLLIFSLVFLSHNLYADFRAGIAVRNVTPEPLLPVIGGVGSGHPATRKQGDLTVRALVLEDGDTRVAIVSSDFLGFPGVLANQVRAAVKVCRKRTF